MTEENLEIIPIKTNYQRQLENPKSFKFKLMHDDKRLVRNGLFLIFLGTLFGAGTGGIIDVIYLYTSITNEYAIMGIGAGIGSIFGILLGVIIYFALKSKMVDDVSASYGAGIGTNVFVGAVIGIFFGVIVGSLFGLILEVLKFTNYTTLSIPVFAILIWTVLGLNIGALVGVLASFGTFRINSGGAIAGIIVGGAGMLAIFGPDVLIAIGIGIGLFVGIIVAVFVKFGVEANTGKAQYTKSFDRLSSCFDKSSSSFMGGAQDDRRRKNTPSDCSGCSGADCSGCNCNGDCCEGAVACCGGGASAGGAGCSSCGCGAGFAGLGPVLLIFLIAIPFVLLTIGLSFVGKKASIKFGGTIKRGALTALGTSFSIFLIIGSNVGLSEAYHNMLFEHNVLIGAGIGLIYALLIFGSHRISIKRSYLEITPKLLSWKDRHTTANVDLENIKSYEFIREERTDIGKEGCYEDYFKFYTFKESKEKVLINCWKTPEGTNSTEYIQATLEYHLSKIERKRKVEELAAQKETKKIPRRIDIEETDDLELKDSSVAVESSYSFEINPDITQKMVDNIAFLIDKPSSVSIDWLMAVTTYDRKTVEEIIIRYLGHTIKEGKILKSS